MATMAMCLRCVTVTLLLGLLAANYDSSNLVEGFSGESNNNIVPNNYEIRYSDFYESPHDLSVYHPTPSKPSPPTKAATTTESPVDCRHPNVELRFTRSGLRRISVGSFSSPAVVKLHLDDNNITEVSCGAFETLPNLRILNMSANEISTSRLLSFGKHDFLRVLYLDGNKYREENAELSEICGSLPQLQELYLRNDGISRFGVAITTFAPRLRLLHLDRNRIESTEFLVNVPVSLAYLHMDDNRIPRIEKNHLKNVEELSVSGNAITQLCRSDCDGNSSVLFLDGAVRLRKLNASRNLITYVAEDAFKDAKALQQLDLSGNRIEKFASFVFHTLETITDLRLSNNRLTSVPSISSLVHLRHLDLSGNQIITISCESFQFLKKLETLLLANNLLNRMSVDHFKKMISLRTMDLSGNQFIDLPTKLLSNSPSLRVLRFRNNKIKDLAPLREEQSSSIFELHLQENPLLHVRVAMLHPGRLPHLVLYLKDANERYCADDDDEGNKDDDKDSDEDSWT
ncbi:uncharacterized protein LOC116427350 isoform X1 [Nomia melanderi]|uniref:uncharacterized protein LOC116427350 isoform X1 n=2 Tax=Nomia melanderi TaxID=2448451 RepID=UPI003FCD213A